MDKNMNKCLWQQELFFHPFHVSAGNRIDFDEIARVAKQGHPYFRAGFYGSGLEGVGGGVPAQTWFAVGNL